MATTSYSSAPLGSSQRSKDLLSAAKSMVSQTQAQGSTPYAGSSAAKAYQASSPTAQVPIIPVAETTQAVPPVVVPPKPQVNAPDATTLANQMRNLGLGLNADGTSTIAPNTQTTTQNVAPTAYEKFAAEYGIPKVEKAPSVTEAYYNSDAYKNMVATQNRLTGLTGQLAAITSKATADQLSVTGQGRGIPEVIIGGQQAQIAKEAAIAALPLQAQIAAEQGNLELAKTHLDTWSKLMVADAEAERQYKKEIRDNVIQFATADQAAKIKVADRIADQQFEMKKLDVQYQYSKKLKEIDNNPVVVNTQGQIIPNRADAQKITKEVVGSDAYKAITKAKDSLQFLDSFEKTFNKYGSTSAVFDPIKNAKLKAEYNTTILNLKEFFNLGVLNGPDETILRGVIPDPTNTSNLRKVVQLGTYQPGTATKAGIENMKKQIEATLDERYSSILSQYGDYSPESIGGIRDLNRIYVEQKAKLNPNIKTMVEENPDLLPEDIISILRQ